MESTSNIPNVFANEASDLEAPSLMIRTEESLALWKTTKGYNLYIRFLHRLCDSVVGHEISQDTETSLDLSPVGIHLALTI